MSRYTIVENKTFGNYDVQFDGQPCSGGFATKAAAQAFVDAQPRLPSLEAPVTDTKTPLKGW